MRVFYTSFSALSYLSFEMSFTIPAGQKFDSAEDIEPLLADLKDGVKVANFGGSSYGVDACAAVANKLKTVKSLEVANLDDMFTGRLSSEIPQSMDDLLSAIVELPNVHTVNLCDNAFGIATIEPLEKFLAAHVPLEHLHLANNGFGPEAGSRVGKALEHLAEKKKAANHPAKLRTVICGRNRLENGSMAAWAKFIKAHGTIEEIRLYQNGIRQEGIELLMLSGLAHAPELKKLDLQDNTFTKKGSVAMAQVISKWPQIEEITVSDCLLSAKGSAHLAQVMKKSDNLKGLRRLRLQYNEINEKGLEHLVDAIESSMPELELLELNGNCFSEDHDLVDKLQTLFEERGTGELDELDDMEEEDSDAEEESDMELDHELEAGSRDAAYAEDEPVAAEKSAEVDQLADELAKSTI